MSVQRTLSILGTGDFGRALAKRFLENGFNVVLGSRRPEKRNLVRYDEALRGACVVSIDDCIRASDVIFLAIHTEVHVYLPQYEDILAGKIIVDVSNVHKRSKRKSNAEKIAQYGRSLASQERDLGLAL